MNIEAPELLTIIGELEVTNRLLKREIAGLTTEVERVNAARMREIAGLLAKQANGCDTPDEKTGTDFPDAHPGTSDYLQRAIDASYGHSSVGPCRCKGCSPGIKQFLERPAGHNVAAS